jgi:hypothetical protein
MDSETITILIFLAFLIAFFAFYISITLLQQFQSKKILKNFSSEKLQHSSIRFSQIHNNLTIREGLGLPVKAEIYYNENLILICPKKYGLFSSLFNFNPPLVITSDKTKVEKLTNHHNIFMPVKIKFTKWNDLIIEYQDWMFTKVKYEITIEFLNKSEVAELSNFKIDTSPQS